MRSIRYVLCALTVTLLAALTLAGCSGGDSGTQSDSAVGNSAPEAAQKGTAGDMAAAPQAGGGAQQPARQVKIAPGDRVVAYTATLRIRAKDVDAAGTRAKQLVNAAGGYVENEVNAGGTGRASLTFKIPADRYTATLDQFTGQLGTKLELRQEAEDVTEEVADVDSRVRSAQATLASFRKLLDRARTVGEVINVEQEISNRQAELESLLARQKALSERTQYATVTLELSSAGKPAAPPDEEDETGFLGGLQKGWDALTAFVSGLLLVFGVLLPFLVPAAVVAVPAYYLRRRFQARTPAPAPPSTE